MRDFRAMARFTRGLVTDETNVRGALLEADDIVPIAGGVYRTRGGKSGGAVTLTGSGNAGALATFYSDALAVNSTAYPVFVSVKGTSGTGYLHAADVTGASVQMPRQVLNSAGAAVTFTGVTNGWDNAQHGAVFGRELLVCAKQGSSGGASQLPARWAGSVQSEYATGTISGTAGTLFVTGSGTTWTSSHEGMFLLINDATSGDRAYRVVRVVSATSIEIDRALPATVAASTGYRLSPVTWWSAKVGTFGGAIGGSAPTSKGYVNALCCAGHAGRMFVGDTVDADGRRYPDRLRWSAVEAEGDSSSFGGSELWHANAFIDVAPGRGGSGILGLASYGGSLYVFKRFAVYVLRGFVATDGTDEGASVDVVVTNEGCAVSEPLETEDGVFFLGHQGVFLLTSSGLRNLCLGSRNEGVRATYEAVNPQELAWVNRRLILHGGTTLAATTTPNVMCWYADYGVWVTQTSLRTSRAVGPNGYGAVVTDELGGTGKGVQWEYDHAYSGVLDVSGYTNGPRMKVTTHPIGIAGPDGPNGRLRAAQVKAKVVDSEANNLVLGVSVLLGEQGTTTAVEAAIAASSSVPESVQTEKWHRVAVRNGTAPVDQVRVRLVQSDGALDCRVMEVGIEHVPVARFR